MEANREIRVLLAGGQGEIEEKKSRFIANIVPASEEAAAAAHIAQMRKRYYDARHNCSAYVIGARQELTRCSDDGEPSGTAGRPMLEVLLGAGLTDVCAVVTRYFGGTLLGTGGLVRAYTAAVQEGLRACRLALRREGERVRLQLAYGELDRVQHYLREIGQAIETSEYGAEVTLELVLPREQSAERQHSLIELTQGRLTLTPLGACTFLSEEKE